MVSRNGYVMKKEQHILISFTPLLLKTCFPFEETCLSCGQFIEFCNNFKVHLPSTYWCESTVDYKLLLLPSVPLNGHYVYLIIKRNARDMPFV